MKIKAATEIIPQMTLLSYSEDAWFEEKVEHPSEVLKYLKKNCWLIINGFNEKTINDLETIIKLHPLTIDYLKDTSLRSKIEEYKDYLFIALKIPNFKNADDPSIDSIYLLVFKNLVITIQENPNEEYFAYLKGKICDDSAGKIRKMSSDFLIYSIIDQIMDYYFTFLEKLSDEIEQIEDQLLDSTNKEFLKFIYGVKRKLIILRKTLWPVREVISRLEKDDLNYISENTRIFFRDTYEQTIHIIESIDTYRDILAGMLDLYISNISTKMNEIMKILTMFSTIFIPLTFITGLFGMNFSYIPFLKDTYGFWLVFSVFIAVAFGMLLFFKRKKWF